MVPKEIKSAQHKLVKKLVKLRDNRSFRQDSRLVLVPGIKMVEELSQSIPIEILLYTGEKPLLSSKELIQTTPQILKKITGLTSNESVAACFPLPKEQDLTKNDSLLILDEIRDPGNVGTLFRSALALGRKGIILTPNTVDPFNDKALRASKGAVFHLPFQHLEKNEILKLPSLLLADLDGEDADEMTFTTPSSLILSNESRGADNVFCKSCLKVKINMNSQVESLNVATSGSILLYLMRPK